MPIFSDSLEPPGDIFFCPNCPAPFSCNICLDWIQRSAIVFRRLSQPGNAEQIKSKSRPTRAHQRSRYNPIKYLSKDRIPPYPTLSHPILPYPTVPYPTAVVSCDKCVSDTGSAAKFRAWLAMGPWGTAGGVSLVCTTVHLVRHSGSGQEEIH